MHLAHDNQLDTVTVYLLDYSKSLIVNYLHYHFIITTNYYALYYQPNNHIKKMMNYS